MEVLRNSSAASVFNNFERISEIPRCSNDEVKISNFMKEFGERLGYETTQDEYGNVLIIKPASEGYMSHDTLVLQSHLDMVCEKTEESLHDFTCDPISLSVEGDFLKAKDTTLGADDGIGVALMMAILEDKTLEHPKLECLFTTTEETGMDGALGLSENLLEGKNLINLDNEEDWIVIVGCAGGIGATLTLDFERENISDLTNYKIKVSGLQGGHSGSMINEPRLNAIKILDSILMKVKNLNGFRLSEINGGSKHNAIPSSAFAIFGLSNSDEIETINNIIKEVKDKNIKREIDLEITLEEVEIEGSYIAENSANSILKILSTFPHGVNTFDKELDVVKSSNNLAIIKTAEDSFTLHTSIRSSDKNDMEKLKAEVSSQAENNGFSIKFSDGYPMWKPNFDNYLLDKTKEVYKDIRGEEVDVMVIHAGLETGILSEKYPEMNMIAIGPNVLGAHTPNERLSISSLEFEYDFLKTLIKNL